VETEEDAGASSSTGLYTIGSGAESASISGFSIDTAIGCSCDGSAIEAERLSARIFNPLAGGVTCCCGRFFFMMVVQESKKSPLNALALQRRIADPNV
jgi:hypothetical protein